MVRSYVNCPNNLFLVSAELYDTSTEQTTVTLSDNDLVTDGQGGHFAAMGITDRETARISVANLGTATSLLTINFLDTEGDVIAGTSRAVGPGQTRYYDYNGTGVVGRKVLRGEVIGGEGTSLLMTMEVFNTSTERTKTLEQQQLIP
jgi:hypothetical protein